MDEWIVIRERMVEQQVQQTHDSGFQFGSRFSAKAIGPSF